MYQRVLWLRNTAKNETGEAGGWGGPSFQPPRPRCAFSRHMAKMGGPWGVDMRLSLWCGHGSCEVVLALKRGHAFERSPHGFCHGWQNGFPGTLKSCSRVSLGSVLVFSRSGAGETHLFQIGIMDSANSPLFSIPWFSQFFRGRRQLPQAVEVRRPRGRGVVSLWVDTGGGSCVFET